MKTQTCDICGIDIVRPAGKLRLDLRVSSFSSSYVGGAFCMFLACADCKPKMVDSQAKIKEFMEQHLKSLKIETNLVNKSE